MIIEINLEEKVHLFGPYYENTEVYFGLYRILKLRR